MRRQLCCFGAMLTVLALFQSTAIAQQIDYRALDNAATELRTTYEVSADVLARDRAAITAAFPDISQHMSDRGFARQDINAAVISGWRDLRLGPSGGPLNEETFKVYVGKLGKLTIESHPSAAIVEIDGRPLDTQTNTAKWLKAGAYKVLVRKEGYFAEEGQAIVSEGEHSVFRRTLKRRVK